MMDPQFKVGQLVRLKADRRDAAASATASYKILRVLPRHGLAQAYGVKTIREAEERYVPQDELILVSGPREVDTAYLHERT